VEEGNSSEMVLKVIEKYHMTKGGGYSRQKDLSLSLSLCSKEVSFSVF
jgi:hypothetical protein